MLFSKINSNIKTSFASVLAALLLAEILPSCLKFSGSVTWDGK